MSSTIAYYVGISQKFSIYMNIPVLIAGVIGGILNLITLLSLKTFRENSCGFYLIIASFFNIGQLFFGELTRLLISGYSIDWTTTSFIFCKLRWYCIQICTVTSYGCLCFATIDQYLSTSSRNRWQQWSNIKLAYRLCLSIFIFSILHGIPAIFFYDQRYSITTGKTTCSITNTIFSQYRTYGYFFGLTGIVPVFVTVLFGSMAYWNVRQIPYRTVPLVRRELDKQLTSMVLVQVIVCFFATAPYIFVVLIQAILNGQSDAIINAKLQLAESVGAGFYYVFFAAPFYIYFSVSKRFRQQLIHVLSRIPENCCQKKPMTANQIVPIQD